MFNQVIHNYKQIPKYPFSPFVNSTINQAGLEIPQDNVEKDAIRDRTRCFTTVKDKPQSKFCRDRIEYLNRRRMVLTDNLEKHNARIKGLTGPWLKKATIRPNIKTHIEAAIRDIDIELEFIENPSPINTFKMIQLFPYLNNLRAASMNMPSTQTPRSRTTMNLAPAGPKKRRRNGPATTRRPAPTRRPATTRRPASTRRPATTRRPAPTRMPAPTRRPAPTTTPQSTTTRRPRGFEYINMNEIPVHSKILLSNRTNKPPPKKKTFWNRLTGSKRMSNKKNKRKASRKKKASRKNKSSK